MPSRRRKLRRASDEKLAGRVDLQRTMKVERGKEETPIRSSTLVWPMQVGEITRRSGSRAEAVQGNLGGFVAFLRLCALVGWRIVLCGARSLRASCASVATTPFAPGPPGLRELRECPAQHYAPPDPARCRAGDEGFWGIAGIMPSRVIFAGLDFFGRGVDCASCCGMTWRSEISCGEAFVLGVGLLHGANEACMMRARRRQRRRASDEKLAVHNRTLSDASRAAYERSTYEVRRRNGRCKPARTRADRFSC